MTISEQIKVLCVRSNISVAELARRMGTTPQNFNSKMKRESFTVSDLEYLAETVRRLPFQRPLLVPGIVNFFLRFSHCCLSVY